MTRRIVGAMSAVGLLVSAILVAPATQGATADGFGWWTTQSASTGGLDLSPTGVAAGPGQMQVSASPAGAATIGAVRFRLEPGEEANQLTLTIVSGVGQEVGIVIACPAATPWTPEEGGPAESAPRADCDRDLASAKAGSDGTLRFALDPDFAPDEGVLDLVIGAGTTDVGGNGITPPFSFVIQGPTSADLSTLQTGDPAGDFDLDPAIGLPPADPVGEPGASTGDASGTGEPGRLAPRVDPAMEPAPTTAGTSVVEAAAPLVVPARGVPLQARRAVSDDDSAARAQRFGLLLFPLAVLGAIYALNASTPGLRGIGRLAHATPGAGEAEGPVQAGLSRFRRDRAGPPVPLR